MNPRQRRGAILIALAVVGAVGVFVAVASYVSDVESRLGPMATVLELRRPVPAYQAIPADAVAEVEIPRRWAPTTAIPTPVELAGVVAAADLPAGSLLQRGMIRPAPRIEQGEREIAILVDAETGVAGKIRPGDAVDIYATFPATQDRPPTSQIAVERATIIGVGRPETQQSRDEGFAADEVVPVTFALTVDESLRLTYIESFADNVRLALRAPTDDRAIPADELVYEAELTSAGRGGSRRGGEAADTGGEDSGARADAAAGTSEAAAPGDPVETPAAPPGPSNDTTQEAGP